MSRLKPYLRPPISVTTKSFNSTINRFSSEGHHHSVLSTFSSMLSSHTPPDAHTYPNLLKACTYLNRFLLGFSLHQRIILHGFSSDSYIASSLITFYDKFGRLETARHVFDKMPHRNVVPWTAMIGCYSRYGHYDRAVHLFNQMRYEGVQPSYVTILNLLRGVSGVSLLECLHASAVVVGLDSDLNLVNCMLNLYGKCGRVEAARDLFEAMVCRDVVSWNSMVSAYAENANFKETVSVFNRMQTEDVVPDQQTFASILISCGTLHTGFEFVRLIHGHILTVGLKIDVQMATSLVVMYAKYGNISCAFKIFEKVEEKDVILWTSMISAFVQNNNAQRALVFFSQMLESGVKPSTATMATAVSACSKVGSHRLGTSVHGYILRQGIAVDTPVQNSLITMYAKSGFLSRSLAIFDKITERDVVSWNAIVAAYAENGDLREALCLLNEMRLMLQKPDYVTVVSVLQACSSTGALQQGRWIHNFIIKSLSQSSIMVHTALIDMYAKCGDLKNAHKCFRQMPEHDVVSWSTIISGYGSHGMGETALSLYSDFLRTKILPNHVMFLSILFSCSHNGLVSEGLDIFQSMSEDFGIIPELEHRACIVDLFCRAGRLKDAYNFIKTVIPEPTIDVLGILLDACRMKGDLKLLELISQDIMMLKPVSAENFVQLAHSYASIKRWDGVGNAWKQMKVLGLRKLPGWSYIQQHGKITTFFNGQTDHPFYEEITVALEILGSQMNDLRLNDCANPHSIFYNIDNQ